MEFTNNDLEWAKQKLREITHDPELLMYILETLLQQHHAEKLYEQIKRNNNQGNPPGHP